MKARGKRPYKVTLTNAENIENRHFHMPTNNLSSRYFNQFWIGDKQRNNHTNTSRMFSTSPVVCSVRSRALCSLVVNQDGRSAGVLLPKWKSHFGKLHITPTATFKTPSGDLT